MRSGMITDIGGKCRIARCVWADAPGARLRGFVGRAPRTEDEGILLSPCRLVHTFGLWRPIDLVYLDRNLRVVKCVSHVGPWRVSSCRRARSTLGVAAGVAHRQGLVPGLQLAWRSA